MQKSKQPQLKENFSLYIVNHFFAMEPKQKVGLLTYISLGFDNLRPD